MPEPRLIHPVAVKVQPLDTGATIYDEHTREPVQTVGRAATVEIDGQLKWGTEGEDTDGVAGVNETSQGYVLFLKADLDAKGWAPKRGDRFAEIAGDPVDLYVERIRPTMHYGGKARGLKVYFEDREPSRQREGL